MLLKHLYRDFGSMVRFVFNATPEQLPVEGAGVPKEEKTPETESAKAYKAAEKALLKREHPESDDASLDALISERQKIEDTARSIVYLLRERVPGSKNEGYDFHERMFNVMRDPEANQYRADLLKGLENVKTIIKTLPLQQLKATFPNVITFDDYGDISTNRINVFKYIDSAVLDDMDKIEITLCENRYDVSEFTKRIGEKYNVGIQWDKETLSLGVRLPYQDVTYADENAANVMQKKLPRLDQALGMLSPAELRDLQTSGKHIVISHIASSYQAKPDEIPVSIFNEDKPVEQMKADIMSQIGNNKEFNLQTK